MYDNIDYKHYFISVKEMSLKVPTILHQVWFKFPNGPEEPPREYKEMRESWVKNHPGWTHYLWNSKNSREFVKTHFPHMLGVYDGYPKEINRVDAIRYFVLAVYGGVYADCDSMSLKPLTPLLENRLVLVPDVNPLLLWNNGLMLAEPNHPVILHCANNLGKTAWVRETMIATGPLYLSGNYLLGKKEEGTKIMKMAELNEYFYHRHDASWTPIAKFRQAMDPERRQYMVMEDVPWILKPFLKGKVGSKVEA